MITTLKNMQNLLRQQAGDPRTDQCIQPPLVVEADDPCQSTKSAPTPAVNPFCVWLIPLQPQGNIQYADMRITVSYSWKDICKLAVNSGCWRCPHLACLLNTGHEQADLTQMIFVSNTANWWISPLLSLKSSNDMLEKLHTTILRQSVNKYNYHTRKACLRRVSLI